TGKDVKLKDSNAIVLGASNVSGNLTATATAGNITNSGTVTVAGTSSFTTSAADADIDLNNLATTGAISVNTTGAGGDATLNKSGGVNLETSNVGGALNVTTTGVITQSGAVTVNGTTTLAAGAANDITLDNTGNDFNIVTVTTGNNVKLQDINGIEFALNNGTIASVDGGTGNNTLTGNNATNTWNITGNNSGTVNTLIFSNFNQLKGGSSADAFTFNGGTVTSINGGADNNNTLTGDNTANTWNITSNNGGNLNGTTSFAGIQNLKGGSSTDNFTLNGGTVTSIDGGTDNNNTLTGDNTANTWNITSNNGGNLNGTTSFAGIQNLKGGSSTDNFTLNGGTVTSIDGGTDNNNTLTGDNTANTWNITGNNAGNVNGVNPFTQIQNLTGSSNTDNFIFSNGASVNGSIDGKNGTDTLNYTAYITPVNVDLATNTTTGVGGNILNMEAAIGGTGANTLIGANTTNTWNVTGNNSGNINSTFTFTNFTNLQGGSDTDTFTLNGGTVTSINGDGGNDTLIGDNTTNTWNITANNGGNLNGTTSFSAIENLTGNDNTDKFIFSDGVIVTGNIDGKGNTDTLNYTAYTTPININLAINTATGVGGNILNMEEASGGINLPNTLIGANTANTWNVADNNSGNINSAFTFTNFSNLTGGSLDDTFNFSTVSSNISGNIHSQDGNLTLTGGEIKAANITTNASGTTYINTNTVTTTGGNQTYANPVVLQKDATLKGNNITFNSTIDANTPGGQFLSINAGTGDITFTGIVGGSNRLNALTITNAQNVTASNSINAASITQSAGTGTTTFNGALNTNTASGINLTGTNFNLNGITNATEGAVTINASNLNTQAIAAANIQVTGVNTAIFNGALNTNTASGINLSGNNFTLNGAIATTENGTVTIANNGQLTIDAAADMTLSGAFLQNGAGGVSTGGDITTTNANISFKSPVNLTSNVQLNTGTGGGDISFTGAISGTGKDLQLSAGTGKITLGGDVGTSGAIGKFTITSAQTVDTKGISAASIQVTGTDTTTFDGALNTDAPIGINLTGTNFNLNGATNATNGGSITIDATNLSAKAIATTNLTITASEIDFMGGNSSVTGTNTLTLQPATASQKIAIAGSEPPDTPALDISQRDIDAIGGFTSVIIGRDDGTNPIAINAVNFDEPVTVKSPSGIIDVLGEVKGNALISLNAPTVNLNGNISTQTQGVTLGQSGGTVWLQKDITLSSTGGNIIFNSHVSGIANDQQSLTLKLGENGQAIFNGAIGSPFRLKGLTIDNELGIVIIGGENATLVGNSADVFKEVIVNALQTNLSGTVRTAEGNITFNGNVTLTDDTFLDTGALAGGNIFFNGTLDSELNEYNDLRMVAGTGDILFAKTVGAGAGRELGAILIENAGNVTAHSTIAAASISQLSGSGATILSGDIATTAAPGVNINTKNNIATAHITAAGAGINFNSELGSVKTGNLTTAGETNANPIKIIALGDITTGNINASSTNSTGAAIGLISQEGNIATNNLTTSGTTGGGNVQVSAPGTITTGDINSSSSNGKGGNITIPRQKIDTNTTDLNSLGAFRNNLAEILTLGDITTGNLTSSGATGGGRIDVLTLGKIQIGQIDSSSTNGSGGLVVVDNGQPEYRRNAPGIDLEFINAQGSLLQICNLNGLCGIDITTDGYFRVLQSFTTPVGTASIATKGDPIIIRHGGGTAFDPFEVGNPLQNGTFAAITNGKGLLGSIFPIQSFEEPTQQDNIQIIPRIPFLTNLPFKTIFATAQATTNNNKIEEDISSTDGILSSEFTSSLNLPRSVNNPKDAAIILKDIEQKTQTKAAIIYATFLNERLELRIVTAEKNRFITVYGTTEKEVLDAAKKLRQQITNPIKRRTKSYEQPAQQLYQWLIKPLQGDLEVQKITNLVFIMDAGLRSLPVAALHDGQGFLIEKYSIGLMPSLNLTDISYKNIQNEPILAMGISDVSDEAKKAELGPLPAVIDEIQTIVGIRGGQSQSLLNQSSTEENLKSKSQNFSIIHLATHGEFKGELDNSYILLWNQLLRLNQVGELGWNKRQPPIELLVLSACKTGEGNDKVELGFAGFAVKAGVKSALASLWYVDDAGTSKLMVDFYQQLKTAPIKAEALRQAQLTMLKDDSLKHPYYWSAFTMIGSPW
ncbi:CHAT domain-containing protein, partial [Limnofasciculus baicalensis]